MQSVLIVDKILTRLLFKKNSLVRMMLKCCLEQHRIVERISEDI